MAEEKIFFDTYKYGTYYNPACLHYDEPCEVGCNRCGAENITASIGWGECDLCLNCIADINNMYEQGSLAVYSDND
jgi:hypothetical protein